MRIDWSGYVADYTRGEILWINAMIADHEAGRISLRELRAQVDAVHLVKAIFGAVPIDLPPMEESTDGKEEAGSPGDLAVEDAAGDRRVG